MRLGVLMLATVAFLPLLGSRDIVTSHEARVAQTARMMAGAGWPWRSEAVEVPAVEVRNVDGSVRTIARGDGATWRVNPWLIPVLSGNIRLQKPPLPYWCAAVGFKIFGVGEGIARAPSALMGFAATLLMFSLGRWLLGSLGGFCCALAWVSSYFLPSEYRKVMADPYLAFFSLLAVWFWIGGTRRRDAKWIIGFYLALALGSLSKGPVVFLHVAVPLIAYHFYYRPRVPHRWMLHLIGTVLFLGLTLVWPIYVYRHIPHALSVWWYESVGEVSEHADQARPWWYYLPNLLQIALPWTPVLIVGWLDAVIGTGRSRKSVRFAFAWYVGVVLIFSLLNVKKNAYLLPVMPAQTLLIGYSLALLIRMARRVGAAGRDFMLLMGQRFLAGIFAVLAAVASYKSGRPFFAGSIVTGGVAVLFARSARHELLLRRQRAWIFVVAGAYVLATASFLNFYTTPRENERSARAICDALLPQLQNHQVSLEPSTLPAEVAFYLPLNLGFDPNAPRVLMIVDDPENKRTVELTELRDRVGKLAVSGARRVEEYAALRGGKRWKVLELTLARH
jgi:4-amino-4-deoxy-L-arabinose transferase-like glycosyltransferase